MDGRTDGQSNAGTRILDVHVSVVFDSSSIFYFPFYGGKTFLLENWGKEVRKITGRRRGQRFVCLKGEVVATTGRQRSRALGRMPGLTPQLRLLSLCHHEPVTLCPEQLLCPYVSKG